MHPALLRRAGCLLPDGSRGRRVSRGNTFHGGSRV